MRLSCWKFRNVEVWLQLHALTWYLGNFMRKLALPNAAEHRSLTTLRKKPRKLWKTAKINHLNAEKSCYH